MPQNKTQVMLIVNNALQLQFLTKHCSWLLLKITLCNTEGLCIIEYAVITKFSLVKWKTSSPSKCLHENGH